MNFGTAFPIGFLMVCMLIIVPTLGSEEHEGLIITAIVGILLAICAIAHHMLSNNGDALERRAPEE